MLKYRFIILQFFFLLFIISPSKSDNKVAYINLDLILSESNSGKILIFELKEFESQILENFNKQEKKLKEEENQILSTQNIVSKEEFKTKVKNFRNKLKNKKIKKKKILKKIKKKKK